MFTTHSSLPDLESPIAIALNGDETRGGSLTPALSRTEKESVRVLHIINGEHYAGAERVQDLLAMRLPEQAVEVAFACLKSGQFPAARKSQQTPVIDLPMRSRFDFRPAWKLAKRIRQERIDLLHTHTPRAAIIGHVAARMAGIPWVHHVHGHTATEVGGGWRTWLSAKTENMSLSGAAAVIAVSSTSADYIRQHGVSQDRIHLISNGVPERDQISQRPTPREIWTLGIVALFRPRKGVEVLLNAFSILNRRQLPVRVLIIGRFETPQYELQTRDLASQLGLDPQIEWRGFRQDIEAELDKLDLLILPSILPEGLPMVVLEAMAAGVPPVGSRVAGIADAIEHGKNGLLFAPGNPESLANEIEAVILGTHDWQQLRHNAVTTHAEKYSDRTMAAQVAKVYREVLQR